MAPVGFSSGRPTDRTPSVRTLSLSTRGTAVACALLAIFLVAPSAEKTSPPSARSYVAVTDTLHVDAAAGKPVLVLLPDRAAYALERAPATSWLVDRTFLWTTGEGDAGRYEILLARDRAGLVDTLVLFVTIE